MSYLKDIDEYTTAELEAELAKREEANKQGLCDYCHRPRSTSSCRFPRRHLGTADAPTYIFINGCRKRVDEFTYLSYDWLVNVAGKSGTHWTMTCHYPSTGKTCSVKPHEYVTVRDDMRVDIVNKGAA